MSTDAINPNALFALQRVHEAALLFLVAAYALKIRSIMSMASVKDRTRPRGNAGLGVFYSFTLLFRPWKVLAYRNKPLRYAEFALIHLGVAGAVAISFVAGWNEALVKSQMVAWGLRAVVAAGAAVGVVRLARRLVLKELRYISTPDDYFSLILVIAWLLTGALALPFTSDVRLALFLSVGTACLFYEPFSKIFHYLYWPFLRFHMGRYFGRRGVYPVRSASRSYTA